MALGEERHLDSRRPFRNKSPFASAQWAHHSAVLAQTLVELAKAVPRDQLETEIVPAVARCATSTDEHIRLLAATFLGALAPIVQVQ